MKLSAESQNRERGREAAGRRRSMMMSVGSYRLVGEKYVENGSCKFARKAEKGT